MYQILRFATTTTTTTTKSNKQTNNKMIDNGEKVIGPTCFTQRPDMGCQQRATRQLVGPIYFKKRWAAVFPLVQPLSFFIK